MKKLFRHIAFAAAAATLAVLMLTSCAAKPETVRRREHTIAYFYADEEDGTRFVADGAPLDSLLSDEIRDYYTCDGTVSAAIAGTGLYRVSKDGAVMVHPAGVTRALVSLDDRYIVYLTATTLHIYDDNTGAVTDVKPDEEGSMVSAAISPDGSAVGFSIKSSEGKYSAYAYVNGECRKLSDDAYLVAIADGAEFWYFARIKDAALYRASGSREKKIADDVSQKMEFNRDLTEVTFDVNGETRYSVNGSAAKPIVKGRSLYTTKAQCVSKQGGDLVEASVMDCGTMFGCAFYSARESSDESSSVTVYDVWYVNGAKKAKELVEGAYAFGLSDDGSTLSCLIDKLLYVMDVRDREGAKAIARNVYSFNTTRDGGKFYGIKYDGSLFVCDREGAASTVSKDAVYSMVTPDGRCMYLGEYEKTGNLYVTDGKETNKAATGVVHIDVFPGMCVYYTAPYDNENGVKVCDVYASPTGDDFALVVKGAAVGIKNN